MIPSLLDRQVRQGVADFVRTTFTITTPTFARAVDHLCDTPGRMFKGPWVSLGLPFEPGSRSAAEFFPHLQVGFAPYRHQETAWERLTKLQSTLVATGTGSGKTECFLYPVLEHVRHQRSLGWGGVKAILIYPMNALATDQARRLARAIHADPALRGKVTAGLYVGGAVENPAKVMGPETLIADRKALRLDPPDILLTNYKMLDYLLTRPKDKALWESNAPAAEGRAPTLRYLVVDELHSFDGAQGTDLALLIRRLKARLGCGAGGLCCVGTSATLGGSESVPQMLRYAGQIFGEAFPEEALVTEQRQDSKAFLAGTFLNLRECALPAIEDAERLRPDGYADPEAYFLAQIGLWFPGKEAALQSDRVKLGETLCTHPVFRVLIEGVQAKARTLDEVRGEMALHFLEFDADRLRQRVSGKDVNELREYQDLSLISLLALVAHARRPHPAEAGTLMPFVQQVRVQTWIRELRRMVAHVGPDPILDFADDLAGSGVNHLPLVYCRECGCAGWAGILTSATSDTLARHATALAEFYKTYFADRPSPNIRFLFPDLLRPTHRLCSACLKMNVPDREVCSCGGRELVAIHVPDNLKQDSHGRWFTRKHCPGCGTRDSLVVVGAQATSLGGALINQLFASPYNDDKKLIAFSDNVQDASQRSAFFGARTWKFNFRAAVQQYLAAHPEQGGQPLPGLGGRMLAWWRERIGEDVATVAQFLPSDLAWMDEVREAQGGTRKSFSDAFWQALVNRLDWEAFTEFGLDCRKGRTLEKSGCSTVRIEADLEAGRLEKLCLALQNVVPALRERITVAEVRQVLKGMSRRWIQNGAILHPALERYIGELGNPFFIHRASYWMKGFGTHSRTPSFPWRSLTNRDSEGRLDPVETQPQKPTSWYAHWLLKHWEHECPTLLSHYEDVLPLLFGTLEEAGVLVRRDVQGTTLWALDPARIRVMADVAHGRCHVCGHTLSFPANEAGDWSGMLCLKIGCRGRYQAYTLEGRYYGDLYARGNLARLHPHEHTSLLQRTEREEVETRFKARAGQRLPWDPNLLSCTPTLEMGIDIGDLSSVLLCSVPPEQSAYVQRIGRAGRSDGNAWIGTVAEGQPHDLYFWEDPAEMIQGRVDPPGVFLDATAVLERQLTAFCLDRWVADTATVTVPENVQEMLIQRKRGQGFVPAWMAYVKGHAADLAVGFLSLLEDEATPATREYLRGFLNLARPVGTLHWKLNDCLDDAEKIRGSHDLKRRQLKKEIERLEKDPAANPDLVVEMRMERDALTGLIKSLDERHCYQFLTDEGLIPNYAFPEAGVQLKSIIYRRSPPRAGGAQAPRSFKAIYEYERAAASAISDFAPGNYFYAHGRKVQIDQVDPELSKPEPWRLCPECGHMEPEVTGSMPGQCPHCQDAGFAGQNQVQDLLRVKQVFATSSDRSSRVGDDSDSREVRFFERALIVSLRHSELLDAWQMDDPAFPFGFEVRRKTQLRELNYGPWSAPGQSAGMLRVAGTDVNSGGFELCAFCGKVALNGRPIEHSFQCRQRYPSNNQDTHQAVLFYRDLQSESLRIFLPTLAERTEADAKSFLAALHLGLKLHYKGDISHLQATIQSEPVPGNALVRKFFVVVYDVVPGGTGYLRQFRDDPALLIEILRLALLRMTACRCNQIPEKDGCYLCLLAHRNSREMDLISRTRAVSLLRRITASGVSLKKATQGVSGISLHSLLESELEGRFLKALQDLGSHPNSPHPITLSGMVEAHGNAWNCTVGKETWYIRAQVQVGPKEGIAAPTRIDFVLTHSLRFDLRIALYLDGWEFHHGRMETDTRQRLALHRSGKYRVWTLSWEDVADALNPKPRPTGILGVDNQARYEGFLARLGKHHNPDANQFSSLRLLLDFMAKPDVEHWALWGYAALLGNARIEASDAVAWSSSMARWLPENHPGWTSLWPGCAASRAAGLIRLDAWLGKAAPHQTAVLLRVDEAAIAQGEGRQEWMDFWRTVNVLQFLPDFVFVAEGGQANRAYDDLPMGPMASGHTEPPGEGEWQELWSLFTEPRLKEALARFHHEGLPAPAAYFEVLEKGIVVAATDLVWPEQGVAVVPTAEDAEACLRLGWKAMETAKLDIVQIVAWMKGA